MFPSGQDFDLVSISEYIIFLASYLHSCANIYHIPQPLLQAVDDGPTYSNLMPEQSSNTSGNFRLGFTTLLNLVLSLSKVLPSRDNREVR